MQLFISNITVFIFRLLVVERFVSVMRLMSLSMAVSVVALCPATEVFRTTFKYSSAVDTPKKGMQTDLTTICDLNRLVVACPVPCRLPELLTLNPVGVDEQTKHTWNPQDK